MQSQSDVFGLEVERALGAAAESPAPISLRKAVLDSVPNDGADGTSGPPQPSPDREA